MMSPLTRGEGAPLADAIWQRRMERRRRWDAVYRALNGGLFIVLLLTVLVAFWGLWRVLAPLYRPGI